MKQTEHMHLLLRGQVHLQTTLEQNSKLVTDLVVSLAADYTCLQELAKRLRRRHPDSPSLRQPYGKAKAL